MARKKKMTLEEALEQLKQTRQISTEMLPAMGMSFELFLRYAQLDDTSNEKFIDGLVSRLEEVLERANKKEG